MKSAALLAYEIDRWCIAFVKDNTVEVRQVPIPQGEDHACSAVKTALNEMGFEGRGVCLGLPSRMVFWAEINCGDLPRKQRRSAMLFRLEELLPMDVETLTADFLPPVGGRTMGAAVQTDRVRGLIDALADQGFDVEAVAATSLLALWELGRGEAESDYAMLALPGGVDVFRLQQGNPTAWYTLGDGAAELERCIRADALAGPADAKRPTARLLVEPGCEIADLENIKDISIERREDLTPLQAAGRAVERRLAGEEAGWVNFLRDQLESISPWGRLGGLLRVAAVLAAVAIVVFIAAMYWRGHRYDAAAREYLDEQETIYTRLYPTGKMLSGGMVASRLESEWRRVAGTSGASAELPERISALETLRRVMESLPDELQVRIDQLRVSPSEVTLDGQTQSHGDAEILSGALDAAGFVVEPPETRIEGDGISFTISARPPAAGGREAAP